MKIFLSMAVSFIFLLSSSSLLAGTPKEICYHNTSKKTKHVRLRVYFTNIDKLYSNNRDGKLNKSGYESVGKKKSVCYEMDKLLQKSKYPNKVRYTDGVKYRIDIKGHSDCDNREHTFGDPFDNERKWYWNKTYLFVDICKPGKTEKIK